MGDGAHDIAIPTFCPATGIFILSLEENSGSTSIKTQVRCQDCKNRKEEEKGQVVLDHHNS